MSYDEEYITFFNEYCAIKHRVDYLDILTEVEI